MVNKVLLILTLVLSLGLAFFFFRPAFMPGTGSEPGRKDGFRAPPYPEYRIEARYDPRSGLIEGKLNLTYPNPYTFSLKELQFNLPAKALATGAEIKIEAGNFQGRRVEYITTGDKLLFLLDPPLRPQETAEVNIEFHTKVPEVAARLGRFRGANMLAGWYPILAPRTGGTWQGVVMDRGFGDPYFADAAFYRVKLILPTGYKVIAGGRAVDVRAEGRDQVWHFTGEQPLREFSFAAGPGWRYIFGPPGKVELVLAGDEGAGVAVQEGIILATAARALDFFQEKFGPYPYSYFHIALVPLAELAGMEYPGLIFISTLADFSPSVVVHEVAHQWWYNLVGTDQVNEPWMDEGLAEYSTLLFYRYHDPSLYRQRLSAAEGMAADPMFMDRTLKDYPTALAYRQGVYAGGRSFWLELEKKIGEEKLLAFLSRLRRDYLFRRLQKEDLLRELKSIE
ncbi:MAG: hypothetical protein PWP65_286 [Clostridia bacterium]|nr:hypothetical protein [Clostridia bacterium]